MSVWVWVWLVWALGLAGFLGGLLSGGSFGGFVGFSWVLGGLGPGLGRDGLERDADGHVSTIHRVWDPWEGTAVRRAFFRLGSRTFDVLELVNRPGSFRREAAVPG